MSTRIIYIQYIKPWSILMVDISLYYFFYIFLYVQEVSEPSEYFARILNHKRSGIFKRVRENIREAHV